jgi:hypothetical protein
MASVLQIASPDTVRRIRQVQAVTIAWMTVEAAVSLLAAWRGHSGFVCKSCSPTHIIHADWDTSATKCWIATVVLQSRNRYVASAPEPVGSVASLIPEIQRQMGERGCPLTGFDFSHRGANVLCMRGTHP